MTEHGHRGLPGVLARPEWTRDLNGLAAAWCCQTARFRVAGEGASAPVGIGAHLRRSFLGALGSGASARAAGGQACDWDPPCALDVFRREQLRGPGGNGLPKPYVIAADLDRGDLIVSLGIFGMAVDWAMAAIEAMATGLRTILPWHHLYPGMTRAPDIVDRQIWFPPLPACPDAGNAVTLRLLSPLDITGTRRDAHPSSLLSRLLRRIDGLSRWNGMALEPEAGRAMAQSFRHLAVDLSGLRATQQLSPNAKGQRRVRDVVLGEIVISGDWAPIWPLLAMGEQAHLGRGAVEGLGRYDLRVN